jgi:hypothetical protein
VFLFVHGIGTSQIGHAGKRVRKNSADMALGREAPEFPGDPPGTASRLPAPGQIVGSKLQDSSPQSGRPLPALLDRNGAPAIETLEHATADVGCVTHRSPAVRQTQRQS